MSDGQAAGNVPAEAITAGAQAIHRANVECDGSPGMCQPDEVDIAYATAALNAGAKAIAGRGPQDHNGSHDRSQGHP